MPDLNIPGSACNARPMPDLDVRTVGDGPKRTTAWLDGVPIMLAGLDAWPRAHRLSRPRKLRDSGR